VLYVSHFAQESGVSETSRASKMCDDNDLQASDFSTACVDVADCGTGAVNDDWRKPAPVAAGKTVGFLWRKESYERLYCDDRLSFV